METARTSNNTNNFQQSLLSIIDVSTWSLKNQGALVVVLDMCLAVSSIFANIIVITAIKQKEEMLSKTFNLVLLNLCSANLVGAALVKSISIVHHGYAVAANVLESEVAFCLLYTVTYRLTMGIMPWSIVTCCWLSVVPRVKLIQVFLSF